METIKDCLYYTLAQSVKSGTSNYIGLMLNKVIREKIFCNHCLKDVTWVYLECKRGTSDDSLDTAPVWRRAIVGRQMF